MLLRHQVDRTNVIRGFLSPIVFFSPFATGLYPGHEVLHVLILWLLLSDINHVLHLHVHYPFTTSRVTNWLLDTGMGATTGMTASVWRIQHVHGHHKHYSSARKDLSSSNKWEPGMAWEIRRYSILGALSYSFWTIFPVFYYPFAEALAKGLAKNVRSPVNFRYALVEQASIVVLVAIMYWINATLTLFYLLPWYFLVQFVSRYTDYLNHVGCGHGFYNASNNSISAFYNKWGNNFGFHSAHHYNAKAHWSDLPVIHEKIKQAIHPDRIKTYSWSGYLMPYHFWLSLSGKI